LVLGAVVKLMTNPVVLRMVMVLVVAGVAFVVGLVMMRRMRRSITEEGLFPETPAAPAAFALHTYHAVIQQLKQQKHELQSLRLSERRRARTSENVSAAVLSHLPCGLLFFAPNGLVRQANQSAKQILGLASPSGMSAAELFRDAELVSVSEGAYANVAEAVDTGLREKTRFCRLEARYETPAGEQRALEITVSDMHTQDGESLGAACLINDQTEMVEIRRQQELRGEMSAEMALALRTSLTTISGYAQQLAASRDAELARQLATDIASEAAHLDRTIGGFLAGAKAARAGLKA
jgi:PAS domain S-box-containing protein